MELGNLKEFIKFMEENNLSELEIEEHGKRIRLKKSLLEESLNLHRLPPELKKEKGEKKEEKKENYLEIKSPMVGTFYRAPSPGAKPYVEAGDFIKPGEIVCIIEAMKLMNEIKAEIGGKIVNIPAENGQPVEFGQPLFLIEPA